MNSLASQDLMQTILIVSLLAVGYFYIVHGLAAFAANKSAVPLAAVIILLLYGGMGAAAYMIFRNSGNLGTLLLLLLAFFSVIAVGAFVVYVARNRQCMNIGALVLFLLYLAAVFYITLFMRSNRQIDMIQLEPFVNVGEAMRQHSLEPLNHAFLNVVMFMPLGFLFAMIDPEYLGTVWAALPAGLLLSAVIEAVQMILKKGQSDIDDIIANVLGAVLGCLIYRVFRRFVDA